MSLTRPIPQSVKERLSKDPFMKKCCLLSEECNGRIEWHHFFKYGGKRMDEWFGILPCCQFHHRKEASYTEELNRIMISRATYEELAPYCKATDYIAMKKRYE